MASPEYVDQKDQTPRIKALKTGSYVRGNADFLFLNE